MGEAVEVAARHPVAKFGTIEVRPFGPEGWWRSAQRHGPAGAPEYLMIHRVDVTADLGPAADCTMPGSPAARSLQAWNEETDARGVKLAGGRLESPAAARTVRVRDGEMLVTDGPFAETKEQLGGYYMVEAKDLDDAVAIASRIPSARFGSIEVRPIVAREGPRP